MKMSMHTRKPWPNMVSKEKCVSIWDKLELTVPERSQFVRERISRFEKPAEPRATPSKKQWRNTSSGERNSLLKGAAPMGRALQRSPAINQTEQIETAQIPAHTSTHNVEPQTTGMLQ